MCLKNAVIDTKIICSLAYSYFGTQDTGIDDWKDDDLTIKIGRQKWRTNRRSNGKPF